MKMEIGQFKIWRVGSMAYEVRDTRFAVERNTAHGPLRCGADLTDEHALACAAGAVNEHAFIVFDGFSHIPTWFGPHEGGILLGDERVVDAVSRGHRYAGNVQLIVQHVALATNLAFPKERGELVSTETLLWELSTEALRLDSVFATNVID